MAAAVCVLVLCACAAHDAKPATTSQPSPAPRLERSTLPDMGSAPALDLRDAVTGRALAPQLAGKAVLISFITTTCKEACPVIEAKFAAVQTKLARDGYLGGRVQIVLVGLDPVEDTARSLAAMAAHVHARTGAFHFATAGPGALAPMLRAFGIAVDYHGNSHVDPDHTVAIYLIDARSRIRYDFAMEYPPDVIGRITEQLADEIAATRG
jgi:protein SCO1